MEAITKLLRHVTTADVIIAMAKVTSIWILVLAFAFTLGGCARAVLNHIDKNPR